MQILGYYGIGSAEMLVLLVIAGIALLPAVFYLITLQTALSRCAAQNRTLAPGLVRLDLIPLFNIIWTFVLVISISKSLANEFHQRGIEGPPNPGLAVGLAMAICPLISFIPLVGILAGLTAVVCWIVYWVKIAGYSSLIVAPPYVRP